MATLIAVGPVALENVGLAKITSVPLVSFDKKVNMVVDVDGTDLELVYDSADLMYKGTLGIYRYRATGPSWKAEA